MNNNIKVIAHYLPQFHPIPENDEWWGKGFTEWTNVTKAEPKFKGHYQPHLPTDLGFYDLRVPETREQQADLAREYGIYGFCYYHYWFHGQRTLDRVFNEVLESGKPDFPFCLCWANENWTGIWGGTNEILLNQTYSAEDDLKHIKYLISAFKDPRYIKINGRPLLLIYRANHIKDHMPEMLKIWNSELERAGVPELYLCSVRTPPIDNFEAFVDFFPPENMPTTTWNKIKYKFRSKFIPNSVRFKNIIVDYAKLVDHLTSIPYPKHKTFLCPVPSWDNSARRKERGALILNKSNPKDFRRWLMYCAKLTVENLDENERFVFINAWNEWAEGTHLEPDRKWGTEYLETIRNVLNHNR